MFTSKPGKKASERRREMRDNLWPGAEKTVWSRKTDDGYSTVPRTLPLIMTLINELSPKSTGDASRAYFELWSRSYDEAYIEIVDEADHAYAAGFLRSRAVRSWRERMRVLVDLGFIKVKPKGGREFAYVLLVHPHDVVEKLRSRPDFPVNWYNSFLERVTQVGARLSTQRKTAKRPEKVVAIRPR